ncbi:hypothetical protein [Burkholderia vietnamiensis]|uniref:hypothetical protein n=1 Tax=Burkholderia vietnamiensis TaxID=60552 RepID=UPI001FC89A8A|nr:hypothetical protein [Burkholderia vietnamiensis]
MTADVRALAQRHCEAAIAELATILTTSENDQARIAAAKELLDRGYGKATQHTEITGRDGAPIEQRTVVVDEKQVAAAIDRLEDEY